MPRAVRSQERRRADWADAATADRLTLATVERIQADTIAFIGAAQWRGRWVMRVSVSSAATTFAEADVTVAAVRAAWQSVREAAA